MRVRGHHATFSGGYIRTALQQIGRQSRRNDRRHRIQRNGGERKIGRRLAREYGAAVICLTIDEEGQARTADWKLRVAKRIYDIAIELISHADGRVERPA